jgi:exonuclease III
MQEKRQKQGSIILSQVDNPLLPSSMKFLSWNCRGFDSNSKVEALKDLVKLENPSVILLQEMKMEDSSALEQAKKSLRSGEGITISSTGTSGGILTLWDAQSWKKR